MKVLRLNDLVGKKYAQGRQVSPCLHDAGMNMLKFAFS